MNLARRVEVALLKSSLHGRPIAIPPPARRRKALLVIDVDHTDRWDAKSIASDPERKKVAATIKKQLGYIRQNSVPVVFVMLDPWREEQKPLPKPQMEPKNHCLGCDRKENKLAGFLAHRHGSSFEPVFVKQQNDAFTVPELAPYLRSLKVEELLIVGCYTFFCVQATAEGAVRNGFNVTLIEDSILHPFPSDDRQPVKKEWVTGVQRHARPRSGLTVAIKSSV